MHVAGVIVAAAFIEGDEDRGIDPLTQFDLAANPMLALFQSDPDLTPYAAKQNQVPLDEFNPKRSALSGAALRDAELSARMDFSVADAADDG